MPARTLLKKIQSSQRPLIHLVNFSDNPGNLFTLHDIRRNPDIKSELLLGSPFAKESCPFKIPVMAVAGAQNSVNEYTQL